MTGFGVKQVECLCDLGLIDKITDIFTLEEKLKRFNLHELNGWGKKSISNLLDAINSRRTITLEKFIASLGIKLVGPNVAKLLAKHYQSYENWYAAMSKLSYDRKFSGRLMSIIGIGEEITASLKEFFSDIDNIEMVSDLASQLTIQSISANTNDSPLSGKTIVFTGTLLTMERNEAQEMAESLGMKVSNSVSKKNTDFVVVGKNPGSKYQKALELGVKILTEKEFLKLT